MNQVRLENRGPRRFKGTTDQYRYLWLGRSNAALTRGYRVSTLLYSIPSFIRCLSSFSFHNGSIHTERRGENEVEEWMRRSGEWLLWSTYKLQQMKRELVFDRGGTVGFEQGTDQIFKGNLLDKHSQELELINLFRKGQWGKTCRWQITRKI